MSTFTGSGTVVWAGRPWIVPAVVARTLLIIVVAALFVWLQFATGTQNDAITGVPLFLWAVVVFFVVWLIGIAGLLIERATNVYTLRNDGLEIRTGVLTSHSFTIVPSGFTDLEVIRGVIGRIVEYGDIVIRTQSERDSQKVMVKVRDPLHVAEKIRYVMGRPIVRLENPPESKP